MGDKDDDKTDEKPAGPGGVKHDARGNAVWEWAAESGRHAIASTSRLLKRLDVPGLKLEDDPEVLKEKAEAQERGDPGGPARTVGYDPYGGAGAGAGPARSAGRVPKVAAGPAPPVKPPPPAKTPPTAMPATKPATAEPNAPSLLRRLFRRD